MGYNINDVLRVENYLRYSDYFLEYDEVDEDNPDDIEVPKPETIEDNSAIKPDEKEKTLIPQSKESENIS